MCHFVKCYSIWTNQLAQGSDQFPLFTQRDNLFITLYFFIWWHVQQRSFFKWNNVTAWKSTKITIDALISEKNVSLRPTVLIYTSSYHLSTYRKQTKINFGRILLKQWNRNIVTPWMVTLIVSWARNKALCCNDMSARRERVISTEEIQFSHKPAKVLLTEKERSQPKWPNPKYLLILCTR